MKRPESHRTGDLGEIRAIQTLTEFGWIVEKLQLDYGFDLLVQRTEKDTVEGDFALVQVKATRHQTGALKNGCVAKISLDQKHLDLWRSISIPTLLVVIVFPTADAYILDCHTLLGQLPSVVPNRFSIAIPETSRVDSERMEGLDSAVRRFWARLRERLAATSPASVNSLTRSGIVASDILGALSVVGLPAIAGGIGGPVGALLGLLLGSKAGALGELGVGRNVVLDRLEKELSFSLGAVTASKIIRQAFGNSTSRASTIERQR